MNVIEQTGTKADEIQEMIRKLRSKARGEGGPTEIVVHARDLWQNDGKTFKARAAQALADNPGTLLVHIIACNQLKLASITSLLQVRRMARSQGCRFKIRPSNRAVLGHLESIGLGRVLAQAA